MEERASVQGEGWLLGQRSLLDDSPTLLLDHSLMTPPFCSSGGPAPPFLIHRASEPSCCHYCCCEKEHCLLKAEYAMRQTPGGIGN